MYCLHLRLYGSNFAGFSQVCMTQGVHQHSLCLANNWSVYHTSAVVSLSAVRNLVHWVMALSKGFWEVCGQIVCPQCDFVLIGNFSISKGITNSSYNLIIALLCHEQCSAYQCNSCSSCSMAAPDYLGCITLQHQGFYFKMGDFPILSFTFQNAHSCRSVHYHKMCECVSYQDLAALRQIDANFAKCPGLFGFL